MLFFVSSFYSGVYRSCQIEKSAKKPQFWTAQVRLSAWKKSRNLKNNSKCQHRKSYELWLRVDLLGLRTTQYTLFAYNSHNNAKRFGDENEENISTMRYRFILLRVFLNFLKKLMKDSYEDFHRYLGKWKSWINRAHQRRKRLGMDLNYFLRYYW